MVNFRKKICFSDEAHFTLGEYVNKQNFSIWGSENSQVLKRGHYVQKKSLFGALFGPKMCLAEIPTICVKNLSKITSKESMLVTLRVVVI